MLNLRSVDLNLLPVFEAAYEERSLSGAAARLAMTQPAVSHALARLRVLCNDDLFVRRSRGVEPTPVADLRLRERARCAGRGPRSGVGAAHLRSAELGAQVLHRDSASDGSADRHPAARAAREHRARGRVAFQHPLAAGGTRTGHARGSRGSRRGLDHPARTPVPQHRALRGRARRGRAQRDIPRCGACGR